MNTIADQWLEFAEHVIPPDAPAMQRRDMRAAFYAGATSILALGLVVSEFSEDAALLVWQSLVDESEAFIRARLSEQDRARADASE